MAATTKKTDTQIACYSCKRQGRCPVMPSGNENRPSLAIIGEAAGEDDIKQGKPFTGRAGSLLRSSLVEVGIRIPDVYLDNAVMFRPEGNKNPSKTALEACRPRLFQNLKRVRPRLILGLGNFGRSAVLGKVVTGILSHRGTHEMVDIDGVKMPAFFSIHPSYVLRKQDAYIDFMHDLERVKRIIDGEEYEIPPPYENYLLIDTQVRFEALMRRLAQIDAMAVDLETAGLFPWTKNNAILSVGMSWARERAVVLDWQALIKGHPENLRQLRAHMERIKCSFHNGQFDVHWLWANGIQPNYDFDTMLGHFCLDERQGSHGLKRLAIDRYQSPEYDGDLKRLLLNRGTLGKGEGNNPPRWTKNLLQFKVDKAKTNREKIALVEKNRHRFTGSPYQAKSINTATEDRKIPLSLSLDTWKDEVSRKSIMKYNGADADYTWRLTEDLQAEMEEQGILHTHDDVMIPTALHFIDLEQVGLRIDTKYQDELGDKWLVQLREIDKVLHSFPGVPKDMNFDSPQQMARFLYDVLKLDPMKSEGEILSQEEVLSEIASLEELGDAAREYFNTASSAIFSNLKKRSTNTYMLHWLGHQHDFPRLMVDRRNLMTKLRTYYFSWRSYMKYNRLHVRYRVHGARTGRMSSTDPNLHGMMRLKEIKNMVIADEGYTALYCDYSQAEIRMLAHLSRDEILRIACNGDIHREVSKQLFRVTDAQLDEMTEEHRTFLRRAAKTIAFGIIYGRMPNSLAPQLGVTVEEATEYRDNFLTQMPDASRYINLQKHLVGRTGEVQNIYGFKRRFPLEMAYRDRRYQSEMERQAVNSPIQGGVSMMTTLANIRIEDEITSWGYRPLPWPHVHDGFGIQVPTEIAEEATSALIEIVHDVGFETDVHFAVEVHRGQRWGDLKQVYEG